MCYLCIVKHDNNSTVPPLVGTPGGLFRVLYKLRGGAEVARQSHNLEHVGSNPTPATNKAPSLKRNDTHKGKGLVGLKTHRSIKPQGCDDVYWTQHDALFTYLVGDLCMIVKLRVHSDLGHIENLDFLSRHAGIAWRLYFCSE